jgi:hypothetical protein
MRITFVLLGLLTVVVLGLLSSGDAEIPFAVSQEATRFFEASNVRVLYNAQGGAWHLLLKTPDPVLCQVNLGPADTEGFTTMQSMEMMLPATDHDLVLDVEEGQRHKLVLTAITPQHEIFRSALYIFTAKPLANVNLIEAVEGEAQNPTPESAEAILASPIEVEPGPTSAVISFTTKRPTMISISYGSGCRCQHSAVRDALTRPATEHRVELLALEPEAVYVLNVVLVDEQARVYSSEELEFETTAPAQTAAAWKPDGENLALLSRGGRVVGVSSNWAGGDNDSSFGANKAIDGDPNTEWSSDGDGDDAWIEIALTEEGLITGIGFWTRTMGTSAQIFKFRVLTADGKVLGVFELPDAKQLYNFDLEDFVGQQLRFEVVESSGGNTGAKEIAIYVKQ